MASLNRDTKGCWRVQWIEAGGHKRRTLRLGSKINKKTAGTICGFIESILDSRKNGVEIPRPARVWLENLPQSRRRNLVRQGLVEQDCIASEQTLDAFIQRYIKERVDLKQSTVCNLNAARRRLVEFFGEGRRLESISPGDADAFRDWVFTKLALNTAKRLCGRSKQLFRAAFRRRLISENPFQDIKGLAVTASPASRVHFIDSQTASAVLDACPDLRWRAIFALARYGGLRVPSELTTLQWQAIDWSQGRMLVNCVKTARHEGLDRRITPLFPEVRTELEAFWRSVGGPREGLVFGNSVNSKTNLRSGLIRILTKAGLQPWQKLFQNLRSSRSTELQERFPPHVVAAWLGHGVVIAQRHYNQVTDDHFSRANGSSGDSPVT